MPKKTLDIKILEENIAVFIGLDKNEYIQNLVQDAVRSKLFHSETIWGIQEKIFQLSVFSISNCLY
jgi:hypothetical protein